MNNIRLLLERVLDQGGYYTLEWKFDLAVFDIRCYELVGNSARIRVIFLYTDESFSAFIEDRMLDQHGTEQHIIKLLNL